MSYSKRALIAEISRTLIIRPTCSLQELATTLNVSKRTVQILIRGAHGVSFVQYRDIVAHELLRAGLARRPGSSLAAACSDLGFPSRRIAARMLLRAAGMSLSELRDQSMEKGNYPSIVRRGTYCTIQSIVR